MLNKVLPMDTPLVVKPVVNGIGTFKDPMSGIMFTVTVNDGEISSIHEGGSVWYELIYGLIVGLWIWYYMLHKLTYDTEFVYASTGNIKPYYLSEYGVVIYTCPNTNSMVHEKIQWE